MPKYDSDLFDPPAPLAKITLRHLTNGNQISDVLMLIDSGADATLIPQTVLTSLNAEADTSQAYELMSFDGGITHAFPVHLDMVFLNRVFRGRYLVIEGEWGVIGRDILNFVPVVLNGPALTWHEFRQTS